VIRDTVVLVNPILKVGLRQMNKVSRAGANNRAAGPSNDDLSAFGKLSFLASYCPLHRKIPVAFLAKLFLPAIEHGCVRFFENDDNKTCASLIWAKLSDDVSEQMIYSGRTPRPDEWVSGHNLWFLDLMAPFNHGRMVAREIARTPPEGPFYFARLDPQGHVRKVVLGDKSRPIRQRLQAFYVSPTAEHPV
jgi:cytolysin-activating lysine-acyltransferase